MGFWDLAGNGQTDRHTHRLFGLAYVNLFKVFISFKQKHKRGGLLFFHWLVRHLHSSLFFFPVLAPVYEVISTHPGTNYGYVKRTVANQSAFVSSSWNEESVASLLCKAAGFSHGGIVFTHPLPSPEMGSFRWSAYFSCHSGETNIEQCAALSTWRYSSILIDMEHANGTVAQTTSDDYKPVKVFCFPGTSTYIL